MLTEHNLAIQPLKSSVKMLDSESEALDKRFKTFKGRLDYALWVRQGVTGEKPLSTTRLGELVGEAGGKTSSQTAASAWLRGVMPRDEATQLALARVAGADPGWLFYGPEHSDAHAPALPVNGRHATASGGRPYFGSAAHKAAIEKREQLERGQEPQPKKKGDDR